MSQWVKVVGTRMVLAYNPPATPSVCSPIACSHFMATLKDIADSLGLDISTVSYALNGKGVKLGIKPERIEQIQALAKQLNYRPNMAARSIRSGRFGNVALLLSHVWYVSQVPGGLLEGVEHSLETQNLRMMIARLPDADPANARLVPMILRELATDGLLIDYGDHVPEHITAMVTASDLPQVWINCKFEQDCVFPDEYAAARRAAEHLLNAGHRRIAYSYFGWSASDLKTAHYSAAERRAGCSDVLRDAGLAMLPGAERLPGEAFPLPVGSDGMQQAIEAARRCLLAPSRPTAVFAYSSYDAHAFVAAAYGLGLRVPEDLSILAFQDRVERAIDKPLTTMLIPQKEIGRHSVAMLIRKMADPSRPQPRLAIELELHPGATVARPPS